MLLPWPVIAWTLLQCLVVVVGKDLLDQYADYVQSVLVTNQRSSDINSKSEDQRDATRTQQIRTGKTRDKRELRDDTVQWTHSEVLDGKGDVVLKWQPRHQEILFRVEARTLGYVGIGFSPNGGMEGADILLGWIDDKTATAYLRDCHGSTKNQGSAPIRDEIDNYRLIYGSQNDTHTALEFRRALDTCDPDDYVLGGDTVRVIWAMHDKDPQHGAEMVYHGERRGCQSIYFLDPPTIPKMDPFQMQSWEVTLKNFEVKEETTYWCKIFKAPPLPDKHHVVGYEPLIGPNHKKFAHHMLLHECEINPTEMGKWEKFSMAEGAPCYGQEMPREWDKCLTPLAAWTIGSKGENFPKHMGIPLGGKSSYFMLEVHFDNPAMKRVEDTTGLRLFHTAKLRKHEGAFLVAGVTISPLHFIPPQQTEYTSAGYCSMDCTKEVLPKDGIHLVSALLHSHLAGRKLKLRHVRAEKELPPIAEDNHYDFNYQQSRRLSHEVTVLPGDGLITECTYSTRNRKKPTLGGYSTREEMCLAFVLYYPRIPLSGCYSMPPIKYFFDILGVKEFYDHNMSEVEYMFLHGMPESGSSPLIPAAPSIFPPYQPGDENSAEANRKAVQALQSAKEFTEINAETTLTPFDRLIIKEPLEFRNKSFTAHLQSLPYNETLLTRRIEEYFHSGLHLTFCRKRDDTLATGEKIEKFPNFTAYMSNTTKIQCSYRQKATSNASSKRDLLFAMLICITLAFLQ